MFCLRSRAKDIQVVRCWEKSARLSLDKLVREVSQENPKCGAVGAEVGLEEGT